MCNNNIARDQRDTTVGTFSAQIKSSRCWTDQALSPSLDLEDPYRGPSEVYLVKSVGPLSDYSVASSRDLTETTSTLNLTYFELCLCITFAA